MAAGTAEERPLDPEAVEGQQAVYGRWTLAGYDVAVWGLIAPLVWRCPRREVLRNYQRNLGRRHVELGPGTGYFLAHCELPILPRVTLVDLNPEMLRHASQRLRHLHPTPVRANVLEPLPVPRREHDSVALNFLLHCVPGNLTTKGVVFGHAAAASRPGGRVFGSTVLAKGVPVSMRARRLVRLYNARGIFHNADDSLEDLRAQLDTYFVEYELTVRGCVAIFAGTVG
ncbi:methyltransferase [Longimycelium tulufanense]|uniref:Methyltransferase n=1 Tax=Longimycelium tulufanense TaxID=907463 RepID=A0A8J3FT91_9PSEU|nr:class I SAM-dependent methyltransferase [Longimycelium tulufanense]GGM36996.1 methyltransferase [Longimycelium tulufanense]